MSGESKLDERIKIVPSVPPQDVGTADITTPSGTFVSMKGVMKVRAVASFAALAATKLGTAQLKQATDATGAGAKAVGSAGTYTSPANGSLGVTTSEADSEEFDAANGFTFVGVTVGSDVNGTVGGAVLELEKDVRPV